jgi:Na+-transporting methylmalonyl-CoA/oxaloacetate decarboxylase gamma subunit
VGLLIVGPSLLQQDFAGTIVSPPLSTLHGPGGGLTRAIEWCHEELDRGRVTAIADYDASLRAYLLSPDTRACSKRTPSGQGPDRSTATLSALGLVPELMFSPATVVFAFLTANRPSDELNRAILKYRATRAYAELIEDVLYFGQDCEVSGGSEMERVSWNQMSGLFGIVTFLVLAALLMGWSERRMWTSEAANRCCGEDDSKKFCTNGVGIDEERIAAVVAAALAAEFAKETPSWDLRTANGHSPREHQSSARPRRIHHEPQGAKQTMLMKTSGITAISTAL